MQRKRFWTGFALAFSGLILGLLAYQAKLVVLYGLALLILYGSGVTLIVLAFEPFWEKRPTPLKKRFLTALFRERKGQPRWIMLLLAGSEALALINPLFYPSLFVVPFWGWEILGGFFLFLAKKQWDESKRNGQLQKWVQYDLVIATVCGVITAWHTQNGYVLSLSLLGLGFSFSATRILIDGFQKGWWMTDLAPNRPDD